MTSARVTGLRSVELGVPDPRLNVSIIGHPPP